MAEKPKGTAIAVEPPHPMTLISMALERGLDPEKLGKLVDLAREMKRDQAAERYAESLAKFQRECPMVVKKDTVKNKDGTLRYKFASYEDVMAIAGPHLANNGISVTFSTPKTEGDEYTMVCRLQVGTHFEDKPFVGPRPNYAAISGKMSMSVEQAFGYAQTYYKRYALCAAAGIVVCGEDNEAVFAAVALDPLTEAEEAELKALLREKGLTEDRFVEWARAAVQLETIEKVGDLPRSCFIKAKMQLQRHKRTQEENR